MKKIEVVAGIVCRENKILATQRGYGEFKDGWEFPGGKLEAGETGVEALKKRAAGRVGYGGCCRGFAGNSGI